MPKDARDAIELADDKDGRLHAVWSRPGKIVTATTRRCTEPRQVELRPDQVRQLIALLSESVEQQTPPGRRSDG